MKIFAALLLIAALLLPGLYAAPPPVASDKDKLVNLFPDPDDAVIDPGTCTFGCRTVISGYITQITDIDANSGTTFCSVYDENDLSQPLGVNANQVNLQCKRNANILPDYSGTLVSKNKDYSSLATLSYNPAKITLSRYLAGMVTLDPDMIDFPTTKTTGILTLKNPGSVYGTNIAEVSGNMELVSTVDNFNKNNMAYYANLFSNMNNIYQYLQNLLFVFVGLFFIATLGFQKFENYISQNNQMQQQSYMSKVTVPLLAISLFFLPIPNGSGMSSSVIQNIIQSMMTGSTEIADEAATIGANTYLTKLYQSVGASTVKGEATIYAMRDSAANRVALYKKAIDLLCKTRFPDAITFQVSDAELAQKSIYNYNGAPEGITAQACRSIERKWLVSSKTYDQYVLYADQIQDSYLNTDLQDRLTTVNNLIAARQGDLGWINAVMMPSASIMVENLPIIKNNVIDNNIKDNEERITKSSVDDDKSWWESLLDKGQDKVGEVLGSVAVMILPGAGEVYSFIRDAIQDGADIASLLVSMFASPVGGIALFAAFSYGGSQYIALYSTLYIYNIVLEYLPLIVSMVAGILVVVTWVIELAKYFYVTPFVAAFSTTMRRSHKIVEFLLTGIGLFFKPVLIVIFIYLALWAYGFTRDLFQTLNYAQFYMLKNMNDAFVVAMLLSIVTVIIEIVMYIGITYMMWKLIISGPGWVLRMVGLDGKADYSELVSGLQGKLEKYSFQL